MYLFFVGSAYREARWWWEEGPERWRLDFSKKWNKRGYYGGIKPCEYLSDVLVSSIDFDPTAIKDSSHSHIRDPFLASYKAWFCCWDEIWDKGWGIIINHSSLWIFFVMSKNLTIIRKHKQKLVIKKLDRQCEESVLLCKRKHKQKLVTKNT